MRELDCIRCGESAGKLVEQIGETHFDPPIILASGLVCGRKVICKSCLDGLMEIYDLVEIDEELKELGEVLGRHLLWRLGR